MLLTKPLCCKAYERGESDVCYTIGQIYELGHGPAGADHQVLLSLLALLEQKYKY